jgi:hypothetical protein
METGAPIQRVVVEHLRITGLEGGGKRRGACYFPHLVQIGVVPDDRVDTRGRIEAIAGRLIVVIHQRRLRKVCDRERRRVSGCRLPPKLEVQPCVLNL